MVEASNAVLIGLVCVIVAFFVGLVLGQQKLIRRSMGEALVAETIENTLRTPHVLINNVTLETPHGTTQIDHVLVAETGIYVIETKHYQGWIFGNPEQRTWTQTIYKKKSKFQNPIHQNWGHINALRQMFTLGPQAYSSLIVFTGEAEFKTDLGPSVIKLRELPKALSVDRPKILDEKKMTYIVGRIEMKRMRRSVELDEYHINRVRAYLNKNGSVTGTRNRKKTSICDCSSESIMRPFPLKAYE